MFVFDGSSLDQVWKKISSCATVVFKRRGGIIFWQDLGVGEMFLLWKVDDVGLGWFAAGWTKSVMKCEKSSGKTWFGEKIRIKNSDGLPVNNAKKWMWCSDALKLSGL